MAKRGRKKKPKSALGAYDWSVDPRLAKEIVAIAFFLAGISSLFFVFGVGGSIGSGINNLLNELFGSARFLTPPLLILLSIVFWAPETLKIKLSVLLGSIAMYFFIPALIHPFGGLYGEKLIKIFIDLLGPVVSYLVLFGIAFVSGILILNISFRDVLDFIRNRKPNAQVVNGGDIDQPKVSVFQSVRDRFSAKAPVIKMPEGKIENATLPLEMGDWKFPPIELLNQSGTRAKAGNIAGNVESIKKTLEQFGIEVAMGDVNIGPTVTQYTLKPAVGVKLNQITSRAQDIALALAAHPIRIEAPIPGKSAVGIEVPNKVAATVTLREILEAPNFQDIKSNLRLALGRDSAGDPITVDLKNMPHLLIAGSTGSGKSIAINSIITSLIYQNSPKQLKMILVDPKRVEFTAFNDIPHLITPVIVEPDKTVNTLKWAITEMERRLKLFQDFGSRDIASYNAKNTRDQLAYIVIIIDELADLMAQSAKEVEGGIVRIAQLARAVGMHLVVATQRPSVDVITGLIKANIGTRMAFSVASQIDSRTIIDVSGAEKLLGKGDMLFLSPKFGNHPKRIQGCLITEDEIKKVADFLREESPPQYDESIANFQARAASSASGSGEIDDDLYAEAKEVVVHAGKASASLLQRRLRVGYARAARLLDLLEEQGVIGPPDGSKPRDVLVGIDDIGGGRMDNHNNFGDRSNPPGINF